MMSLFHNIIHDAPSNLVKYCSHDRRYMLMRWGDAHCITIASCWNTRHILWYRFLTLPLFIENDPQNYSLLLAVDVLHGYIV